MYSRVSAGVGRCCFNDGATVGEGVVRSSAKPRCTSTRVAEPRERELGQRADARVRTWSPSHFPGSFGRISKVYREKLAFDSSSRGPFISCSRCRFKAFH